MRTGCQLGGVAVGLAAGVAVVIAAVLAASAAAGVAAGLVMRLVAVLSEDLPWVSQRASPWVLPLRFTVDMAAHNNKMVLSFLST